MKSKLFKILAVASAMVLVGCAERQVERQVDAEVKAEPAHVNRGEMERKSFEAVDNSNLTSDQKAKLTDLIKRAHQESAGLWAEDTKVKGVLIEAMTSTPYRAAQVEELKGRLRKLNEARIKNTMRSISEIQKIVGVNDVSRSREDIYRELLMERPGPRELQ
jgi:hypothetical protein